MGEWATEVACQVECIMGVTQEECITAIDPISKLNMMLYSHKKIRPSKFCSI